MTDRIVRVVMTAEAQRLLNVASQAGSAMQKMGGQATTASQQTAAGFDRAEQSGQRFERRANSMGRAIAATFGGLSLVAFSRELVQTADQYSGLIARLRLATTDQREFNFAQEELFDIAQRSRAPLDATISLYSRIAPVLRDANRSQQDTLNLTEAVGQALAISGASAAESGSAILQLSQALAAGALRGDEFNSVNEAAPRLMRALADGIGVPIGELRKLAEQGELTAQRVTDALLQQAPKLAAEYNRIPATVSGSLQRVQNEFLRYVGRQDQAAGSSAKLAEGLNYVANNFKAVAESAIDVGAIIVAAIAGRAVGGLFVATNTQLKLAAAIVTTKREAVLQAQAAVAQAQATLAVADAELAATAATQGHTAALLRQAQAQVLLRGATSTSRVVEIEAAAAAATTAHTVAIERQAAAAAAHTAAVGAQTAAVGAASIAVTGFRTVLAALGGPVGIAVTLLTGLAFWFMTSGDEAEKAGDKIEGSLDGLAQQAREIDAVAKGIKIIDPKTQENLAAGAAELGRINRAIQVVQQTLLTSPGNPALLKDLDQLQAKAAEIQAQIAAVTASQPTGVGSTAAMPGTSAAAQAEAEFARVRAVHQAANAQASALADQQVAQLDEQLRRNLIGYRDYYTQRAALETAAVQREIANRSAELAQIAQMRATTGAEKPKTDDQRDEQAKKLAGYEADRIRVLGEIAALKTREQTIDAQTQAQIDQAAADAEKRLGEVRTRMAQLQGDAAGIAAETRAKLEREYAALLNDPSTTDQSRSQIRSLIDRETLQAEFDAVRSQADSLMQDLRQRWDSLSQSVQAGTIGTAQAQSEYARSLSDSNPQLQQFLQQLQQLSDQLGPSARQQVQGLSNDVAGLSLNTRSPLQQLAADWSDTFGQMQQVGVSAMRGVADSLTDAMMTGKLDAKSMMLSIVADLIRVQIQAQLTAAALKLGQTIGLITSIGTAGAGAAAGGGSMGGGAIPSVGGTYTPVFRSKGGAVRGPGTETSDSIPAWLSNHEFVFKAASAKSLGSGVLNLLNEHGADGLAAIIAAAAAPAYAQGGAVGTLPSAIASTVASSATAQSGNKLSLSMPFEINLGSGSDMTDRDAQELGKALKSQFEATAEQVIRKHLGPRGMLARSQS